RRRGRIRADRGGRARRAPPLLARRSARAVLRGRRAFSIVPQTPFGRGGGHYSERRSRDGERMLEESRLDSRSYTGVAAWPGRSRSRGWTAAPTPGSRRGPAAGWSRGWTAAPTPGLRRGPAAAGWSRGWTAAPTRGRGVAGPQPGALSVGVLVTSTRLRAD